MDWIPVTEKLPPIYTPVLVTYDSPIGERVAFKFFRNPDSFDESVLAWMPLPDPWQKETDP